MPKQTELKYDPSKDKFLTEIKIYKRFYIG